MAHCPGATTLGHLGRQCHRWLCIGLAIAWLDASPQLDPVWRLAIITGFLGALTTFSSFSAEVVGLLQAQRWGMAIAWAAAHLFASLLLTITGIYTVQQALR